MSKLFFGDEESLSQVHQARVVCFGCPIFSDCLSYATKSYPNVQYGIFAGYPPSSRKAIFAGKWEAVDWRETWDPDDPVLRHLYPVPTAVCRSKHSKRLGSPAGPICAECGVRIKTIRFR